MNNLNHIGIRVKMSSLWFESLLLSASSKGEMWYSTHITPVSDTKRNVFCATETRNLIMIGNGSMKISKSVTAENALTATWMHPAELQQLKHPSPHVSLFRGTQKDPAVPIYKP